MTKTITTSLLKKLLKASSQELEGDWVLLGGALLPYLGVEQRTTSDVDLVRIDGKGASNADGLRLMEISDRLGLPVETLNTAAGFFLNRQKDFKKHLILLEKAGNWSLFRPDAELFLALKAARMTESDLEDCLAFLKLFPREVESSRQSIVKNIDSNAHKGSSAERRERLETLRNAVKKLLRS